MKLILPNQSLVLDAFAVLVNSTPGNTALKFHYDYIGALPAATAAASYKQALDGIFASYSNAQLGTALLTNLGLTASLSPASNGWNSRPIYRCFPCATASFSLAPTSPGEL